MRRSPAIACWSGRGSGKTSRLGVIEDRQAVLVADRYDRFREPLVVPGRLGAFLAFDREGVRIVPAEAVLGGDDVGGDALRHEIGIHREGGIDGDRRPVRAHGHAAHHLDTARDIAVTAASLHLIGGKIDGFQAGGTEAVDRKTGDILRRDQRPGPPSVPDNHPVPSPA